MCVVDVYSFFDFCCFFSFAHFSFFFFFFRFSSTVLEPREDRILSTRACYIGYTQWYEPAISAIIHSLFFLYIQTLTVFHALAFMYKKLNSRLAS